MLTTSHTFQVKVNMKKLKIEKKHLADIEFVRAMIDHHNKYTDILVDRIAQRIGITSEQEKEILSDHVYNGSDWTVEIIEDRK